MSEIVNLTKGGRIDLTKTAPSTTVFGFGLGWSEQKFDGADFDLDASAFQLKGGKVVNGMEDFIFYNNLTSKNGAITHMGDDLVGGKVGDCEVVNVDVAKIDTAKYDEIDFNVTIYEAAARKQTFGMVDNAFIRVFDAVTGKDICRYDLTEDFSTYTAVVAGKLYFKDGSWRFQAVGGGYTGGLVALCAGVGIAAIGG